MVSLSLLRPVFHTIRQYSTGNFAKLASQIID